MKIQNHIDSLTKERNEKETILESLVEGVIAVDVDMQITYTNHMAMKLLNHHDESFIGKNFSLLTTRTLSSSSSTMPTREKTS